MKVKSCGGNESREGFSRLFIIWDGILPLWGRYTLTSSLVRSFCGFFWHLSWLKFPHHQLLEIQSQLSIGDFVFQLIQLTGYNISSPNYGSRLVCSNQPCIVYPDKLWERRQSSDWRTCLAQRLGFSSMLVVRGNTTSPLT